jgi:GTP-binding protein
MKITKAEFICSNTRVDLCPKEQIPEYAFIGRSNVGKSSLINMLVERKKLAKDLLHPRKDQTDQPFQDQ